MIELRLEDGTLLDATGVDIGTLQATTVSDPLVLDISYLWGQGPGSVQQDLVFRLATEDPLRAGVGLMKGVPPQDEHWARARFVGHDNSADPQQADFRTDWLPLGAYLGIPFPTLHAGCSRRLELAWQVPASGQGSWVFLPTVDYAEHARALAVPHAEPGIVAGCGDRSRSGLVRGGRLSASDPAGDTVQVEALQALDAGELVGQAAQQLIFDRVDGDGVALADGEIFRARVAATVAGAVARRGAKALDPLAPPLEIGDLASLGVVRVEAPVGGGPPVIVATDLEEGPRYDRCRVEAVPGQLEVLVHAGDVIGGGTWRFWQRPSPPVPLAASSVSYLWQLADGRFEVTAETSPPAPTAIGPWAEIETDATQVIRLEDRRILRGPQTLLSVAGEVPAVPGPVARLVIPVGLQVDRVVVSIDAEPDGPLVFDLEEAAASRLVAGTEPSFDVGTLLVDEHAVFETGRCHAGTVLELRATSVPATPSATVSVTLVGFVS